MKRPSYIIFSIIALIFITGCSNGIKSNLRTKNEGSVNPNVSSKICSSVGVSIDGRDATTPKSFSWVNVPKGWCASDIGVADSSWGDSQETSFDAKTIADTIFFSDVDVTVGGTDKSLYAEISYDPDHSFYDYSVSGEYEISLENKDNRVIIFSSDESDISMREISQNGFPATYYRGFWKKSKCTILIQTVVSDFFTPPYDLEPSAFMKLSSEMLQNISIPDKCFIGK